MKENADHTLEAFMKKHKKVLLDNKQEGNLADYEPRRIAAEYPVYWPFGKHAQKANGTYMREYETRVDAVYQLAHKDSLKGPVFLVEYKCRMENASGTRYEWTQHQAKENMARTYALKHTKDRRQAELNAWMFYLCTGIMVRHVLVVQTTRRRLMRNSPVKRNMKEHWAKYGVDCEDDKSVGGQCGVPEHESPFGCVACLAVDWGSEYMQTLIRSFAEAPYRSTDFNGAFYADSRFVVPNVAKISQNPWKTLYKSEFTQANICAMWMSHCLLGAPKSTFLKEFNIDASAAPTLVPNRRQELPPQSIRNADIIEYRQPDSDTDYAGDITLSVSCAIVAHSLRQFIGRQRPAFPLLYTPYQRRGVLCTCYYWGNEPLQIRPASNSGATPAGIIRPEALPNIQFAHRIVSRSEPHECRIIRQQINDHVQTVSEDLTRWLQQEFPAAQLDRIWRATTRGIYQRNLNPDQPRIPEFADEAPYGPQHGGSRAGFVEKAFVRCVNRLINQRLLRAALALGGTQLQEEDQLRFPHCSQRTTWTRDALGFVTAGIFTQHGHNMIQVAKEHIREDVRAALTD